MNEDKTTNDKREDIISNLQKNHLKRKMREDLLRWVQTIYIRDQNKQY